MPRAAPERRPGPRMPRDPRANEKALTYITVPPSRRTLEASEELYYDELDEDAYADDEPLASRRNTWLRWLFWVGTALAPVAAVLLVMGQGVNPLRAAAALAILGVVCIGLSVTLRDSSNAAHAELAEDLQREVDEVRSELETLRRGVQLTVNRELGRVRGELEAAQQVLRTEATRLPPGTGRARSPEPGVTPVPARSSARSPIPPRKNLLERRVAAVAEPTDAVPVAQQVPSAVSRENGYGAIARRSVVHDDARAALQGSNGRGGGYPNYDPLASTASHPIVTQASARQPFSDPYTVEPIREKYSSTWVPSQRDSYVDRAVPSHADTGMTSRDRSMTDSYGSDAVFGDVLPLQHDSYDSGDKWSWATSTSTQDWQPDFDLPSLDGLPMPGYAVNPAPEAYVNGRPSSASRSQGPAAPSSASAPTRHRGGGRHCADEGTDASWSG